MSTRNDLGMPSRKRGLGILRDVRTRGGIRLLFKLDELVSERVGEGCKLKMDFFELDDLIGKIEAEIREEVSSEVHADTLADAKCYRCGSDEIGEK